MRSTCDVSTGLRFFKICHSAELNKVVEAKMPVNPYDDCRISLGWRTERVIWTSLAHRKANVTEA